MEHDWPQLLFWGHGGDCLHLRRMANCPQEGGSRPCQAITLSVSPSRCLWLREGAFLCSPLQENMDTACPYLAGDYEDMGVLSDDAVRADPTTSIVSLKRCIDV